MSVNETESDKPKTAYDPIAAEPLPRRMTGRGWLVLGVLGVIFIALWLAVFKTYQVAGTSSGERPAPPPPTNGMIVQLQPLGFDPSNNEMKVRLQFEPTGTLKSEEDWSMTADAIVSVYSDSGVREVILPAHRQPSASDITIGTEGNFAAYPLDTYQGEFQVITDLVTRNAGGQVTGKERVMTAATVEGSIDGWDLSIPSLTTETTDLVEGTMALDRAGNTMLFAFFLLGLMTVLVGMAVVVAIMTVTNRRHIEVDLLGWFAGLLFALPFLRQIFPGAPEVGAAIDVYVFLWLLALAMIAAVTVVVGWLRQNRAELLKAREESEAEPADQ